MNQEKFDITVVIGRFQPYHKGHRALLQKAAVLATKKMIVLVGSATSPRSIKNPFTFAERKAMIIHDSAVTSTAFMSVQPIEDFKYNDLAWVESVQEIVQREISVLGWSDKPLKIALVGLNKDQSTIYLKWFPQWTLVEADQFGTGRLDASAIRDMVFGSFDFSFIKDVIPESTYKVLEEVKSTSWWSTLIEEYEFIKEYKRQWAAAPYAPTFVTVDAVVFQQGHVLLVKRGASPGKGLWALPGGFVNQNERLEDACIRELREETNLRVPEPVLRGSIFATGVFDSPDRSLRGRTITHAFGVRLSPMDKLPSVKGGDDAAKARWVSLSDIKRDEMFEDHFDILEFFKRKL
jgi:bifunctional NMN adenylyltransferase/nudix hydrolase